MITRISRFKWFALFTKRTNWDEHVPSFTIKNQRRNASNDKRKHAKLLLWSFYLWIVCCYGKRSMCQGKSFFVLLSKRSVPSILKRGASLQIV